MAQSYAALQEMIENLKAKKEQEKQKLVLKLDKLYELVTVFENASTRNVANLVLTEQIPKWKEYQALNLNDAKVRRMLARIQQVFVAAKQTTLELNLLEKCENLYKNLRESFDAMDQTITSIEQLISTFEVEENNENNLLKLTCTIQQAQLSFQANFDEVLLEIQKIEENYHTFTKMMEDVDRTVCWEIKQHEEITKKTQEPPQEIEKNVSFVPPSPVKMIQSEEEPATLDAKFCSIPREPKQTKKDAYITALRIWVDEKSHTSSEKIAFANYLFQRSGNHLLAKDKRWRPLTIFSMKTTSMATAQGLLAHSLSDQDRQQLLFDKKCLDRKKAQEAYDVEMGSIVKKSNK